VLLRPKTNLWIEFQHYYLQYGQPNPLDLRPPGLLGRILRILYCGYSHFTNLPPLPVLFATESWKRYRPAISKAAAGQSFDFIWWEETPVCWFAADLNEDLKKIPCIVSSYNIETHLRSRLVKASTDPATASFWASQERSFNRLETRLMRQAVLTVVCSENDAKLGRQLVSDARLAVVGNGVDTNYFTRATASPPAAAPVLLFTGGFGYEPNSDAVQYFADRIFAQITAIVPDCHFVFAGREAQRLSESLKTDDPRIFAIDSPDDMRPVFETATVFVVPLRSGGGTRLKILEAMSMELPVVSTSVGAEGLSCEDGVHLVLADGEQAFADSVIALLQHPERRRAIGRAAANWVRREMDWSIHREQLKSCLSAAGITRPDILTSDAAR
jgi:glycosyltransferase involved in cell wall biosynthesis